MISKKAALIIGFALICLSFFGCSEENTDVKSVETVGYGEITTAEIYLQPEDDFTLSEECETEPSIDTTEETMSEEEKEQEVTKIILENPPYEGGAVVLPDDELQKKSPDTRQCIGGLVYLLYNF